MLDTLSISVGEGLWAVCVSGFVSATLLPGNSEVILFLFITRFPEALWLAVGLASLANTLGGMTSYVLGRCFPDRHSTRVTKVLARLRRFGTPLLLISWVPLIGDTLCLAAGWLRLNLWQTIFFMILGKALRYIVIAYSAMI